MPISRRAILTGMTSLAATSIVQQSYQNPVNAFASDSVIPNTVRRSSAPSDLRIVDMRYIVLKDVPHVSTIIRIDTNQGISGWGEVRDGASPAYAMILKSRILGENPCDVDRLFRKIKQFGGHGRQGGGVSAVEMALWDLAGKAYGVPIYQLIGGKFRDKIRIYADTRETEAVDTGNSLSGKEAGQLLRERIARGITWLKCDMGIGLLRKISGTLSQPFLPDQSPSQFTPHPFNGIEVTPKGIDLLVQYLADIRDAIGMEIPLAIDHLGPISVNSAIRIAKALEPFSLAWIEDPVPWQYPVQLREIMLASQVPVLTGEDVFLTDGFRPLIEDHVVDMIHPDLATAGGILETKKIGDLAWEQGMPMVLHCAGSIFHFMASVHCAAATENFLCLEHHGLDISWWDSLGIGPPKSLVQQGFIDVPTAPGLGVDLNEEVAKEHLARPGFFLPTKEWDTEKAWDRTWS